MSRIKNLREFKNAKERRSYLEQILRMKLPHIGNFSLEENTASTRNCENMIGVAQIPMGIAGPLKTKGEYTKSEFMIPLATTEGALIASVNRGCKAINLSDGVYTYACRVGATRGPVFYVKSLNENKKLYTWIEQNEEKLKVVAKETSLHLKLRKIMTKGVARYLFSRFYFDTQDAMGMNMATIATQKIIDFIKKETGISCLSLAGNFDIDKKPAFLNFTANRGFKVWAEVILPQKVVSKILKTTSQKLFQVWLGKCVYGAIMSGSLGFNGHFANIIAALFTATGQDTAHVVEGSLGITSVEIEKNGDLYFSIYLPDLMIGTVGGGTGLATQKEALSLLGVYGGDSGRNALKFAEIVGGAVLAGELSLLASLAEGSLVRAHKVLGRGEI